MTVAHACGCLTLLQQKLIEYRQARDMHLTPVQEVTDTNSTGSSLGIPPSVDSSDTPDHLDSNHTPDYLDSNHTPDYLDTSHHDKTVNAPDLIDNSSICIDSKYVTAALDDESYTNTETIGETYSEQPDDQSDGSSLGKQLSSGSDDDNVESITYKLALLDSLCHMEDIKSGDSFIA